MTLGTVKVVPIILYFLHGNEQSRKGAESMNIVLTEEYKNQTAPVKQHRDEELQYAINKLRSQGRSAYLDVCAQIVHPHRATAELGIGSLSSVELQECGYKHFAAIIPDMLAKEGQEVLVSVHLCEAPGGFIDRTSKWCKQLEISQHTWLATSKADGPPFSSHLLSGNTGQIISDANMQEEETVRSIADKLRDKHVLFITADSDIGTEQDSLELLFNQIYISLDVLESGGLLIIKIMEFYQHGTKLILWLLFNVFGEMCIEKPRVSACCSQAKYVICSNFNKLGYSEKYKKLCQEMRETKNYFILEFPLAWSYWLTDQQNKFTQVKESWQRKAVQVCNILITQAPYLSQHHLHTLIRTCWKDTNIRQFIQEFVKDVFP